VLSATPQGQKYTSPAFPRHLGLDALEVGLLLHGNDHPETEHVHAGQPPDALWPLRIVLDPVLVRDPAHRTAAGGRVVAPGAATGHVREAVGGRQQYRIQGQLFLDAIGIEVLLVLIDAPFHDIAVHVVQAPRVRLAGAHLVGRAVLVVLVARVLAVPGVV